MPAMRNAYRGAGPAERFRPMAGTMAAQEPPKRAARAVSQPAATPCSDADLPILQLVDRFLERTGLTDEKLGHAYNGDSRLVARLRRGRQMQAANEARLRKWLAGPGDVTVSDLSRITPADAAALRGEVADWCRANRRTMHYLGTLAGQNGDWQARLAEGRLTLKVARRLRAIMANCQ